MLLADLGADVVKVETLPHGDPARQSGPFRGGESVYYMASNRNKRSLALDLRTDARKDVLYRLIDQADVFVQNFRPGTAEAMGFGPEQLQARNPRLILHLDQRVRHDRPRDPTRHRGSTRRLQGDVGLMSVHGDRGKTGPLDRGRH